MIVPATNNGQEGSNRRFGEDFGVHPSLWSFVLTMSDELETSDSDIRGILLGTLTPPENETYTYLKKEREIAKANHEAGLITLDDFLGKLGALSMKAGKQKVASDADPEDDTRGEKRRAESQDSSVPSKKATRGRRGKLPSFVASKNSVSSNLPWPSAAGLAERIAMPSTLARTTSSAVSSEPPRASIRPPVINIDTSLGSNNSLLAHISKYGLGLKSRAAIPGEMLILSKNSS